MYGTQSHKEHTAAIAMMARSSSSRNMHFSQVACIRPDPIVLCTSIAAPMTVKLRRRARASLPERALCMMFLARLEPYAFELATQLRGAVRQANLGVE